MITPTLPTSLKLSLSEMNELESLTSFQLSAMAFWKHAFASRGIQCPHNRVLMMVPARNGSDYRLEWHAKRLGPQAIRQGEEYRAFAAKRDAEWAERLQKQGREVWH